MMQVIDLKSPVPKYYQIRNWFKDRILCGKYVENEKLASYKELSLALGTTCQTISQAMKLLEQDGLITCIQGKGIFVKTPKRSAGSFLLETIHHACYPYNEIFHFLEKELGIDNYHFGHIDILNFGKLFEKEKEKVILRIIGRNPHSLLIDGDCYIPFHLFAKHIPDISQLIFINRYETAMEITKASKVLVDYFAGGKNVAEHLIGAGRKNLLILTFTPHSLQNIACPGQLYFNKLISGFKSAAEAADCTVEIVYDNNSDTEQKLRQLICSGVDGILCIGDYFALSAYNALGQLNLKPGRDVDVIGFFNTEWCYKFNPALTSVSICPEIIAAKTAELIEAGAKGETIMIEPKIIVRNSAGTGSDKNEERKK